MVCITCPLGCRMELDLADGKIIAVRHNSCQRGIDYAHQELYDPRRMVTATAAISGGTVLRVPVRTSAPLPVQQIPGALEAIYALRLTAPLAQGTIVIKNVADSGIDILTTRAIQSENA